VPDVVDPARLRSSLGITTRVKTLSIVVSILLVCLGGCVYVSYKPVWDFDHLESKARKSLTGSELQMWATNLLARHTNAGPVRLSEAGADFPKELRRLAPVIGPHVRVKVPDDTNLPSYVQVSWGSGFLGCKCFLLGPTNMVVSPASHVWQPGVYFCRW
jgi:hypothetical protein